MNIELKLCPFCGGEAEMMGDQYPYVECQECAGGFTANHSYDADEGDAASKWNARSAAGPNLKPIAESKVRQLGGDVCGVLVRTDGGVMAISEHGRCTRLDTGVMGPVEPAGMSERELFEQRFPVPAGIYWNDISEQYDALPGAAGFDDVEIYHGQWMGWQAARAQGGQGVAPVAAKEFWRKLNPFVDEYIKGYEYRGDAGDYHPSDKERGLIEDCVAGLLYDMQAEGFLNTHTQPAQQGVPEETEAMVDAAVKVFEDAGAEVDLGWLGEACRAYVAASFTPVTPQPAQQDPDLQLIEERDYWEGKATELAEDVGKLLGVEVGEHSSANCPVQNAIDAVFHATEYPAQQGSVPDGWRECLQEMVQAMHDYEMSVDEDAPYKHRAMMDRAHALLSNTPQPEGDWVRCSERLPKPPEIECRKTRKCGWQGMWSDLVRVKNEKESASLGMQIYDNVCPKCGCKEVYRVEQEGE